MDKLSIDNLFNNTPLRQSDNVFTRNPLTNAAAPLSFANSLLDKLNLSGITLRLSREIANFNYSPWRSEDEKAAAVPEISDEYVGALLAEASKVAKPNSDLDDLTWAMVVQIGKEVGVSDPDVLMAMKVTDLTSYFKAAYAKNSPNRAHDLLQLDKDGNDFVKSYANPADIWNDIFLNDGEGSFLKDKENKAIRNKSFQVAPYLKISGRKLAVQSVEVDIFAPFEGELTKLAPSQLQNYLLAIHSGDFDMMQYAGDAASSKNGKARADWRVSDKVSLLPHEERMQTYKKMLATGYYEYKRRLISLLGAKK